MQQHLDIMTKILEEGEIREDRTGTGTMAIFGTQTRFNLKQGLPVCTTRKVHLRSIIHELLWFLKGDTDVTYLQDNKVSIWDDWLKPGSKLLPHIYGENWCKWKDTRVVAKSAMDEWCAKGFYVVGAIENSPDVVIEREINQVQDLVTSLTKNPYSRRHILTAWNPATVNDAALPACHTLYQFYVSNSGGLSCHMYQR